MRVKTTRFGELDIDDSKLIRMPEGVLGFGETNFIILTPPNMGPFCWFQAVDNPDLAFVVVDPSDFNQGYCVKLTAEELAALEVHEGGELLLLAVVTMAADPADITVNLQGPIALNPDKMVAKQIVLDGINYSTRHPLFYRSGLEAAEQIAARGKTMEAVSAA
ncbi:flagellar assembly protein FliW [Geobacter sp. DSM 9736]|uniref:flagellar assembly protein FliW n=1 Tax=Geobacter sp. DSM 9736 TaxID=1277350 RepID=UPI000B50FF42|nr:flagellar assembly protein FliW [Geobacter sp. DSM 9736]SNB47030.1 flagellar assembly factor FliW [Geobacter sp. DSM 9736]